MSAHQNVSTSVQVELIVSVELRANAPLDVYTVHNGHNRTTHLVSGNDIFFTHCNRGRAE